MLQNQTVARANSKAITTITAANSSWQLPRWTLVHDSLGKPDSILTISTDITQQKILEAQFLRAQRLDSIGVLAGGIAHDLNNVLAPILMSGPAPGNGPRRRRTAGK